MILFLEEEEKSWLLRNSKRKFTGYMALPEREKRHKLREANCWTNIIDIITTPTNAAYNFNRQQLKLMQELVIEQMATLGSQTLPAYQRRVANEPKLQLYIDKCEALHKGLLELSGKLQGALR